MGAAPMTQVLWQRHVRFDPADPSWPDRDRFVLSPGHGSMLLYALLHLYTDGVSLDDLRAFRQWGSATPGHPEYGHTPGVECTTGPLGQGSANAVGMAMAERWLAARYNTPEHTIVDHHTYALISDGDVMEGISNEAASIAGHMGLGKLICLYDANDVSLDGPLSLACGEDVGARYEALGWHVQTIEDGDGDLEGIDTALQAARTETARPSLIIVRTTIGFGSPSKAGKADCHGAPLGADDAAATKAAYGWDPEATFHVPAEVPGHVASARERGSAAHADWRARFTAWAEANPERAAEWERARTGELPAGWDADLPSYGAGEDKASRAAGGEALRAIAAQVPWLVGGDADISASTKTNLPDSADFGDGEGRNVRYGVREHAMGAIANGMAYHGGMRPYTATFFVFSDYMRPAMRLAALCELPVVHVFTHDSIGVGEDGPTHQPVEHLSALRTIPGLHVVRPGDPNETAAAWRYAMARRDGPTTLVFSRQTLPALEPARDAGPEALARGAYVLAEAEGGAPDAILIGTGSELSLCLAAQALLAADGIRARVVSMPCWDAFQAQPEAYRDEVLPPSVERRLAVEAGASHGWHRWVGLRGGVHGVDRFGASAPGGELMERFGFTAEAVADAVRALR
jgi:transketolase